MIMSKNCSAIWGWFLINAKEASNKDRITRNNLTLTIINKAESVNYNYDRIPRVKNKSAIDV